MPICIVRANNLYGDYQHIEKIKPSFETLEEESENTSTKQDLKAKKEKIKFEDILKKITKKLKVK